MKKSITVLLVASAFFCSCAQSSQKKAEKLVTDFLKDKLYNPQSYESISFSDIDTLFIQVGENEQCLEAIEYGNKSEVCDNKRKQYLSALEAQSDTMSDEFRRSAVWKNKLAKAKTYLTSLIDSSQMYSEKAALAQLKYRLRGKFGGWKLEHQYKAKNDTGAKVLDTGIFYLDSTLTKVIHYQSKE